MEMGNWESRERDGEGDKDRGDRDRNRGEGCVAPFSRGEHSDPQLGNLVYKQ